MSTPTSVPSIPLLQALPAALQAQLDAAINLLIIGSVFATVFVPVAVALFFFSDSRMRKKPVFILNECAILLGLAFGALNIYNMACILSQTISARSVPSQVTTALSYLYFFIPICVECILLVRIVAVYPPRMLSWTGRVVIYGTFAILTVARIINVSFGFHEIVGSAPFLNAWALAEKEWVVPYVKVEWFLQLAYNTFASMLFLLRLGQGGALRTRHDLQNSVVSGTLRSSYSHRLRALFWLALSNFVFPVFFNIAQLVLIFRDPLFYDGAYVLLANVYVTIISVLLATLWCSGTRTQWQCMPSAATLDKQPELEDGRRSGHGMTMSLASLTFAPPSLLEPETAKVVR